MMKRESMIAAVTSDIAGKVRGKAFPVSHWEKRLKRGVGWTPTNVQITCFDAIADSPYGALGDLLLVPDPDARVEVDFGDDSVPERFALGDILSLEGEPWECCTRSILKKALARLEGVGGVALKAAFEHEFHIMASQYAVGEAYTLSGYRAMADFGETLMAALHTAGLSPDTLMKEYGAGQYEVTVDPSIGVRAADEAAILRELTRATAIRCGEAASFTPIRDPSGVGNGVHIHMSLLDRDGSPATHDPDGPHGLSPVAGSFVAGILKYLDAIIALTAPSAISYERLTPHRWSAAYNNLGFRDREASVRICPVTSRDPRAVAAQYNIEFRAADAAASPHLALAAIVHAGAQGIEEGLSAPEATEEDLSLLDADALASRAYIRLPQSLSQALARFNGSDVVSNWFDGDFAAIYHAHKQGELAFLEDLPPPRRYEMYEAVY